MTWRTGLAIVAIVSAALFCIDFFFSPYPMGEALMPRLGIDLVLLLLPVLITGALVGFRWNRVAITFTLLAWYGGAFLEFLLPATWQWLTAVSLAVPMSLFVIIALSVTIAFSIPLLLIFLIALFKLRWKSIGLFGTTWALLIIAWLGNWEPSYWVTGQGFRIHTLLVGDYLSKCHLTDFIENGIKQTVGLCEGFDRGNYIDLIVHDTTGEFVFARCAENAGMEAGDVGGYFTLGCFEETRLPSVRKLL